MEIELFWETSDEFSFWFISESRNGKISDKSDTYPVTYGFLT